MGRLRREAIDRPDARTMWEYARQVGLYRFLARTLYRQVNKRVFRREIRLRLATGGTLIIPRLSMAGAEAFVTNGCVDHGAEQLLLALVDPDRDFIDVGAHIGYYACLLAPRVRRVYALEPDPRVLPVLRRNAAAAGNVEVISAAVTDTDGHARLSVDNDPAVSHLVDGTTCGGVRVDTVTLDTLVANGPTSDVCAIKIDIEGHDMAAIRGATRTLAQQQPLVLTEFNESPENQWDVLRGCAESLRYALYGLVRTGRSRRHFVLQRLDQSPRTAKMVFMAPPRLRAQFAALATDPASQ
jgi:FkbM family methyltransferase